jgi:hypothetical protein
MLCKDVKVDFGPQLSFNDLPTYIEVTVSLESARNIGLQEIFSKFNTGGIRTISGTQSGEYLPGIADSFWNYKQLSATSSTLEAPTGEEPQSTDNIEKTDNKSASDSQDNQSKVTVPTTTTSPTESLDSGKAITADPQSTDKVLVAGASSDVDSMRVDNSQDTTGSTDGAVDQVQNVDDKPYTGEDAKPNENLTEGSTKKPKYKYTIKQIGPKKWVEATDESGNIIYTGNPSSAASEEILILEMRMSLSDNEVELPSGDFERN